MRGGGRQATPLATTEEVWERHLGPLLDVEQMKTVLAIDSRQVSEFAERGRLLVLEASGGRTLYPALQFGPEGRPYPELAHVLATFAGVVTSYTVASWLVSPQDLLEGETPAAWMRARRDPERLHEASRRAAAVLAH